MIVRLGDSDRNAVRSSRAGADDRKQAFFFGPDRGQSRRAPA